MAGSHMFLGMLAVGHVVSAFTFSSIGCASQPLVSSRRASPLYSSVSKRAVECQMKAKMRWRCAAAAASSAKAVTTIDTLDDPADSGKTFIIGGGPAGLTTAMMLAKKGWTNIHVYERLPAPPSPDDETVWDDTAKFYLIGLGGRGQKALKELGAWDEVEGYCTTVVGRMDWAPGAGPHEGKESIFTNRPYLTKVIARDRLVGVLARIVRSKHADQITLHHGIACTGVSWLEGDAVEVTMQPTRVSDSEVATGTASKARPSLLIGADGAARAVADSLEEADKQKQSLFSFLTPWRRRFKVSRYEDDNQRVYKTIPLKLPDGWRGDLNYSARTKDGRINIDALPSSKNKNYCAVLLLRAGDPLAQPNTNPADLRKLLDESLPMFSPLISHQTLEAVAVKPVSRLPTFRFVGPQLHRGASTLLIGDAVHTVKPYFGLGANSALEDVIKFSECLEKRQGASGKEVACVGGVGVAGAIEDFSRQRAPEARALVKLSREFDRPGALGFVTFILPLILDGIFSGFAPKIFSPNTIVMLQRDSLSFQQVRNIKRRDRLLQLAAIAAAAAAVKCAVDAALAVVPRAMALVVLSVAAIVAVVQKLGVFSFFLTPNTSPADVLAKTREANSQNEK